MVETANHGKVLASLWGKGDMEGAASPRLLAPISQTNCIFLLFSKQMVA